MKKNVLFILTLLLLNYLSTAQSILWEKTFGGSVSEKITSVWHTTDGGYVFAGSTVSIDKDLAGCTNVNFYTYSWVFKLNALGALQWKRCLNDSTPTLELNSIQQTNDGGYIAGGRSRSGNEYYAVKLNSAGNILWEKTYGGTGRDICYAIKQTNDGGYIMAGVGSSNTGDMTGSGFHGATDCWIVKLDTSGIIQWQKAYGGNDYEYAYDIEQTTDGGYIVVGTTDSYNDGDVTITKGQDDYWIFKLNATGVLQWQKSYGGSLPDIASSVHQTTDGGYIVAGYTTSIDKDVTGPIGSLDFWILKLSATGVLQWKKNLGGTKSDSAKDIIQTTDGGYIIAGRTFSNDVNVSGFHQNAISVSDLWIVKLNNTGAIEWQKCLGGSLNDEAYSIRQIGNGNYIIGGFVSSIDGDAAITKGEADFWIINLVAGSLQNVNATVSKTFVNCNNPNSGTATVTPTGGTSPYSYLWSNGATSATATGLAVGNYKATVIDNNGDYYVTPSITITKQRCFTLGPSPINVPFIQMPGAIIPR